MTRAEETAPAVRASAAVYRDAALVGAIASLVKVLSAVKVIVTARYFGTNDDVDAYFVAFILPAFFTDTMAATFTPSLVPPLIRARMEHGAAAAHRLLQNGLAMILATMLAVSVVLVAAGPWMLPLLGSSFGPEKLRLTTWFFWSMLIWLPLGACSAAWRAVLNAHDRVLLAVALQMFVPVFTMAMLAFGAAQWGVWILCVGIVLAVVAEFAVLAIAVKRLGYPLRPYWMGWGREITGVRRQYVPLMAGTMLGAACGIVDQAVAASLGSGSVAALSYATKFAAVLIAIGGGGLATVALPQFTRIIEQERWEELRRVFASHLGVALLAMTPVVALLMWGSVEVVRAVFQSGAFGPKETAAVSEIQRFYLLQVPFSVALMVTQRLATALSATPLILRAGAAAMLVNVTGDLLLPRWMGAGGIALASSIGQGVFLASLLLLLYRGEPRVFRATPSGL